MKYRCHGDDCGCVGRWRGGRFKGGCCQRNGVCEDESKDGGEEESEGGGAAEICFKICLL